MSPFSQILGLSLVVHLSVILLTKKFGGKRELRHQGFARYHRLISLCIIGIIAVIVFSGASVIVFASIVDPHSNIHIMINLMEYASTHFREAAHAGLQSARPSDLLSVAVPLPLAAATKAIHKIAKR